MNQSEKDLKDALADIERLNESIALKNKALISILSEKEALVDKCDGLKEEIICINKKYNGHQSKIVGEYVDIIKNQKVHIEALCYACDELEREKNIGATVVNENVIINRSHKIIDVTPLFYGIDVNDDYCLVKKSKVDEYKKIIETLTKSAFEQGEMITDLKKPIKNFNITMSRIDEYQKTIRYLNTQNAALSKQTDARSKKIMGLKKEVAMLGSIDLEKDKFIADKVISKGCETGWFSAWACRQLDKNRKEIRHLQEIVGQSIADDIKFQETIQKLYSTQPPLNYN